jgi:hypothetical protein
MEAGYRLTSIHLDEEMHSLPPMQEVSFEDDRITTVPVEGWVDPLAALPPGDYTWTTEGPDGSASGRRTKG